MLTVQTSPTGQDGSWTDTEHRFKSKKAAKEWFDQKFENRSFDWRVGFLVRSREGVYYRLRHPNQKPVDY